MAHDAQIYRLTTASGSQVADHVTVADTLGRRTKGLMFRSDLAEGSGIVIKPCSSIHMFFMRIPIDVAFVDGDGKVLHICHSIRPWRISRVVWRAKAAIELGSGALKAAGVKVGDTLSMTPAA